jgi:hypothetical protein
LTLRGARSENCGLLAHAQDILTIDWDMIVRLCEFFHASTSEAPG